MNIDKKIHEVYEYFEGKEIRWHNFEDIGVEAPYYGYYYAEDRLYVLRDCMTDSFWFVYASSPADALDQYKERMEEAYHAGEFVMEGEE